MKSLEEPVDIETQIINGLGLNGRFIRNLTLNFDFDNPVSARVDISLYLTKKELRSFSIPTPVGEKEE